MTTALFLLPLAAAVLVGMLPLPRRTSEGVALMAVLAELALAVVALIRFDPGAGMQFVQDHVWIAHFVSGADARFHVGMDGLSLFMVLLTAVGSVSAVSMAMWAERARPRAYFALLLLLQAALVLLFTAQDLVLFYVGWEAMMIPLYVLMGVWGGPERRRSTLTFVVYTLVGSLLMLVAIAAVGVQSGSFEIADIRSGTTWIFFFFAAAFCVKAPIFPLHGWLPLAYRQATPEVTALLSGVISKAGVYGLLRIAVPMFPGVAADWRWLFLGLALAGLLYGSVLAFRQEDARGVMAYSSVGQLNLIIIGIFALNANGATGAVFQMVNHGLVSLAAFLLIGLIELRTGTDDFRRLRGLANRRPLWSTVLLITALFALAVPGSSTFVSEFYVLLGAFQQKVWLGGVAAFAIVLAAMYMLRWYSALAHEDERGEVSERTLDLRGGELSIAVPLVVVMLALSAYPFFVMHRVQTSGELVGEAAAATR